MNDFRCGNCKRLLAKIDGKSRVEIVCPKCKTMNVISEIIHFDKEEATRQLLSASKGLLTPDNFETARNEGIREIDADTWKDKFKVEY